MGEERLKQLKLTEKLSLLENSKTNLAFDQDRFIYIFLNIKARSPQAVYYTVQINPNGTETLRSIAQIKERLDRELKILR